MEEKPQTPLARVEKVVVVDQARARRRDGNGGGRPFLGGSHPQPAARRCVTAYARARDADASTAPDFPPRCATRCARELSASRLPGDHGRRLSRRHRRSSSCSRTRCSPRGSPPAITFGRPWERRPIKSKSSSPTAVGSRSSARLQAKLACVMGAVRRATRRPPSSCRSTTFAFTTSSEACTDRSARTGERSAANAWWRRRLPTSPCPTSSSPSTWRAPSPPW